MQARRFGIPSLVVLALILGCSWYSLKVRLAGMHPALIQYSLDGGQALLAYLLDDYRSAGRHYRAHFARAPQAREEYEDPSAVLLVAGAIGGAEGLASAALKENAGNDEARLTLAEVALARGDLDAAAGHLARVAVPLPRRYRDEPTKYSPRHEALLVRAVLEMRRGDDDAVLKTLQCFLREERPIRRMSIYLSMLEALGGIEASPRAEERLALRAHLHHYLALSDRAHYRAVATAADRAIEHGQHAAEARLELAFVQQRDGQASAALETLLHTLAADPRHAETLYRLSHLYEDRGDLVSAYEARRRAWDAEPLEVRYHDGLMKFLADRVGDYREAIEHAGKYLTAKPQDAQGLYWAGHLYWLTGELARSNEYFARAVQYEPDDPLLYEYIAHNQERLGRIEEAIATYQRAIAVAPARGRPKQRLGGLYMNLSNYAAAVPLFEAAFATMRPSARDLGDLCASYAAVSRYRDALACFEHVRIQDPGNALAARLMPEILDNLRLQEKR